MKSKPLSSKELELIKENLGSLRNRALFILGYRTGFRISELLSLYVEDIKDDMVSVKRRNMKGKHSSRTVPLHSEAKQILEEYVKTLAPGNSKLFPITRMQAWRLLKQAAEASGLSGQISTHSMRKTFGMKVYEVTGRNIVAAQMALGHKSLASTSHYLSIDQEIVDKAILS